jgi:hypothetical protein
MASRLDYVHTYGSLDDSLAKEFTCKNNITVLDVRTVRTYNPRPLAAIVSTSSAAAVVSLTTILL